MSKRVTFKTRLVGTKLGTMFSASKKTKLVDYEWQAVTGGLQEIKKDEP